MIVELFYAFKTTMYDMPKCCILHNVHSHVLHRIDLKDVEMFCRFHQLMT